MVGCDANSDMKTPIIVYHDCCHDGITALWAVLRKYPDGVPYPGKYEAEPDIELMRGRDVIIVDFSWKHPQISKIKEACNSLLVIDHHKTAQAELAGFDFCVFDMDRSGAGLTWDTLFPDEPRPQLINYVEDRDLWKFSLPYCKEIHLACNCEPLSIDTRQVLIDIPINELIERGKVLQKYHDKLVNTTTRHKPLINIAGHLVPCVGCATMELISDVGHVLAVGQPFAATYFKNNEDKYIFSLRSSDDGVDVSEIAKCFGGGGHKHAAGFAINDFEELSKHIFLDTK
jgi:oligoribonuclease NrnB/cAMP/cGMP phosphodiesterase (DHH superfamily)